MISLPPLGGYPQFAWSGRAPFAWGDGGRSRISYGTGLVPDLVRGLEELPALAAEGMPGKAEVRPAVIGCVYRLTSSDVVSALLPLECCIVVDRQQRDREQLERLHSDGNGLSSLHLPGFNDLSAPGADGRVPVIGPGSAMPEPVLLGPVRAAGWAEARRARPLVHVKMLFAGRTWVWEDEGAYERFHFTPLRTWLGSANWTDFAPFHLEFGLWSDDPELMAANQHFLLDVIRFSQDLHSSSDGPEPELVAAEWDNQAFAEYMAEMGPPEPEQFDDDY